MQPESLFDHETVLLGEAVLALDIKPSGVYVDGTYGRGGHSERILSQLGNAGRLVVVDKDPEAIADAQAKYASDSRVSVWQGSFRDFSVAVTAAGVESGKIDGLLLDLGVSSPQLDDASRGFSFMREGGLDMRMNPDEGVSAAQWLFESTEKEIADVLWRYGEERFSKRIARAIKSKCAEKEKPLETTLELADLIVAATPNKREPGKHPATRSFQAIRIKINQELEDVEQCLHRAVDSLLPNGRLVVISFHSLEDRVVKHFMRDMSRTPRLPKGLPVPDSEIPARMRLIGKASKASQGEVSVNPRSRSAIMRVAEMNAPAV
ncbi:MAG: rRNA small subunit methyltransferase H [uncultured Thiotrichaceae bacterium]|uniref:Ribosomal RNA small subunit methyltransferase H n=1 Tax=uncultured Thiotrichaceae bacterium TaxID=298394 RepID=A0A6S6SVR3_9GAMM|nr:MAG: rRNA small subunit methyltransferase H [uncultured Thiotrichaceae bacterium]